MARKAKKSAVINNPDARIKRGRESPKAIALPGSEGDTSTPPRSKIAITVMKEL
jgi:hypothetical protein